jgi:hypothetical protein
VIKGDSVDWAELAQVILERNVVTVPCNDIEGGEGLGGTEQLALVLQYEVCAREQSCHWCFYAAEWSVSK